MVGLASGRLGARQITLFDSVGFAIEDFSALQYVRERVAETGFCETLDMIADPDDPRDLFGMLARAVAYFPHCRVRGAEAGGFASISTAGSSAFQEMNWS